MAFQRVELELKTVTPAFIGGSDPVRDAEWAAKSVRGHLRWWFRALMGGEMRGAANSVRKREDALFGSTDHKSAVKLLVRPMKGSFKEGERAEGPRMSEADIASTWGDPGAAARLTLTRGPTTTNPMGYLGYGPLTWDNRLRDTVYARARFVPDQTLHLLIQWNDSLDPALIEGLRNALQCWLALGGIGGRTRRGFGSLECTAVRAGGGAAILFEPIRTIGQFEAHVKSWLAASAASSAAEWSHFTNETRVYVSTSDFGSSWQAALKAAGAWLIAYRRRYGVASDERTRLRNRDYVWLKDPKTPPKGVPDRAGFGLPLPFGRGAELVAAWRSGKRHKEGDQEETGRRGSPLLIHVARFEGKHYLVFTHMPALLVPKGAEIHFRDQHLPPTFEQKGIVRDFLDDLASPAKKKIRSIP
jgi:CRISPR-associated protein Cmr1